MLKNIYKKLKELNKTGFIAEQVVESEIVNYMAQYVHMQEITYRCKELELEIDPKLIYEEYLKSERNLFEPEDILYYVCKIEGRDPDEEYNKLKEDSSVVELSLAEVMEAQRQEEITKLKEEIERLKKQLESTASQNKIINFKGENTMDANKMNEELDKEVLEGEQVNDSCEGCEETDCPVKGEMFKLDNTEAMELINHIEGQISKQKRKNLLTKVGVFVGGTVLGALGVVAYAKYAPASTKTNIGTDLFIDTLNKKRADVTREDIALITDLFQAKSEYKTGLINGEEYAEKFERITKL